jgi:hypothetical protein
VNAKHLLAAVLLAAVGCAHVSEADQNMELARTKGKFQVRLTQSGTADAELVEGKCKFVRMIMSSSEGAKPPTRAELPDWFRTEAAYYGADTVIVRDNAADAYICGPGPINPDGTRQEGLPPARPQPTPPPR